MKATTEVTYLLQLDEEELRELRKLLRPKGAHHAPLAWGSACTGDPPDVVACANNPRNQISSLCGACAYDDAARHDFAERLEAALND